MPKSSWLLALVALLLLALPLNLGRGFEPEPQMAGRRNAIEGDYRRLD